jgi:hypothetical protein
MRKGFVSPFMSNIFFAENMCSVMSKKLIRREGGRVGKSATFSMDFLKDLQFKSWWGIVS